MTGDELLNKYAEQFGEAFPLYMFSGDNDKIIKTIKNCLKNNTPYKPEYEEDVDY